MKFRITDHAVQEMERRQIPRQVLDEILAAPQQIVKSRGNRSVYQSQIVFSCGRMYLVRVVVDDTVDEPVVLTVYRTSRISKYWRTEQ